MPSMTWPLYFPQASSFNSPLLLCDSLALKWKYIKFREWFSAVYSSWPLHVLSSLPLSIWKIKTHFSYLLWEAGFYPSLCRVCHTLLSATTLQCRNLTSLSELINLFTYISHSLNSELFISPVPSIGPDTKYFLHKTLLDEWMKTVEIFKKSWLPLTPLYMYLFSLSKYY